MIKKSKNEVCPSCGSSVTYYHSSSKYGDGITRVVYADGIHDDTEAIQLIANWEAKGVRLDGSSDIFGAGTVKITKTIIINKLK